MSSPRTIVFRNDYFYHLFNRGVERRPIFLTTRDRERFVSLMEYYRFGDISKSYSHYLALSLSEKAVFRTILEQKPKAIDIIAYCLMPNHFHLLIQQKKDHGIHHFLSNIANGYAKYFNAKRQRVGPLYQGPFKSVLVETDDQLIHLSRYIHINPVVSSVVAQSDLATYQWSSLPRYLGESGPLFVSTAPVLIHFKTRQAYRNFVFDQIAYASELEKIKHLGLEEV